MPAQQKLAEIVFYFDRSITAVIAVILVLDEPGE
jgi:hypothetical protein